MPRLKIRVRSLFNELWSANTEKCRLPIGDSDHKHESDLFEKGEVIGGIRTSPWKNRTEKKTNNTGGQDRAAAELLWLSLWPGTEKRIHILTDWEMAVKTYERFCYGSFPKRITIYNCDYSKNRGQVDFFILLRAKSCLFSFITHKVREKKRKNNTFLVRTNNIINSIIKKEV